MNISKINILFPHIGGTEYITVSNSNNWNLNFNKTVPGWLAISKLDDNTHIKIIGTKNNDNLIKEYSFYVTDASESKLISIKIEPNVFLEEEDWTDFKALHLHNGDIPVNLENMEFKYKEDVNNVDNIVKNWKLNRCYNWEPTQNNITIISSRQTLNQSDDAFIAYLNMLNYNYMLTGDVIGLTEFDFDVSYYDTDRRTEANLNNNRYLNMNAKPSGSSISRMKIAANNGELLRKFINNTNNHFVGLKLNKIYYIKPSGAEISDYEGWKSVFSKTDEAYSFSGSAGVEVSLTATYLTDTSYETVTYGSTNYKKYNKDKLFTVFDSWAKNWKYKQIDNFNNKPVVNSTKTFNLYEVKVGEYDKVIAFKNDFIIDGSDNNGNAYGGLIFYNKIFCTQHSLNLYKLKIYKTNADASSAGYYSILVAANGELDQLQIEGCTFKGLPTSNTSTYNFPYTTGRVIKIVTEPPKWYIDNCKLSNLYSNNVKVNNIKHIDSTSNHICNIYIYNNHVYGGYEFISGDCMLCTKSFRIIDNVFEDISNTVLSFGTNNDVPYNVVPGFFSCPLYVIGNEFYGTKKFISKRYTSTKYYCAMLTETAQIYFSGNKLKNILSIPGYFLTKEITINNVKYALPCRVKTVNSTLIAVPIYQIFRNDSVGSFVSNGQANQTFTLNTDILYDHSMLVVKVNGTKWSKVDTLNKSGDKTNRTEYSLTVNDDYTATLKFGSGTYSKIPESNASIIVSYDTISDLTFTNIATYDVYCSNVKVYFLNNNIINLLNLGSTSGNQGILKAKGTHIPSVFYNTLNNDGTFTSVHAPVTRCYKWNKWTLDVTDSMFQESIGYCGIVNNPSRGRVINPTSSYHFGQLSRWGTSSSKTDFTTFESLEANIMKYYGNTYSTFDEFLNSLTDVNLYKVLNNSFNNPNVDYDMEINEIKSMNTYQMFPICFGYLLGSTCMDGSYKKFMFSNNEINWNGYGRLFGGDTSSGGHIQQLEFNDNKINVGYIIQTTYTNTGKINPNSINQTLTNIKDNHNALFPYFANIYYYNNGSSKNESYLMCENNEFTSTIQEGYKISLFMLRYTTSITEHKKNTNSTSYYTFLSSNYGRPGYISMKNNKVNNNLVEDFEYYNYPNTTCTYPRNSLLQINRHNTNGWGYDIYDVSVNSSLAVNDIILREEIGYDNWFDSKPNLYFQYDIFLNNVSLLHNEFDFGLDNYKYVKINVNTSSNKINLITYTNINGQNSQNTKSFNLPINNTSIAYIISYINSFIKTQATSVQNIFNECISYRGVYHTGKNPFAYLENLKNQL